MTPAKLRSFTAKDLGQLARKHGVSGWHSMRKEELIKALLRLQSKGKNGLEVIAKPSPAQRRLRQMRAQLSASRDISSRAKTPAAHDRLVVMVRDPYWLQAYWELTSTSVSRARASMGQKWHTAKPVLRVFRLRDKETSVHERDIVIHGGVSHWYLDVSTPPASYRIEIGYRSADGQFFCIARSNSVSTPASGTSDASGDTWSDIATQADRIYAMSGGYSPAGASRELQELLEERLQRPMGSPMRTRFGSGASLQNEELRFAVDAEITVFGFTSAGAHVTLKGEPVKVREDGSFAVQLPLPEQRQVIPVVASDADGMQQRTIILAVERNTKTMEPVVRDIAKP